MIILGQITRQTETLLDRNVSKSEPKPWGGYSETWAWYGGSMVITPIFEIFNPIGSLFYTSSRSD